MSNGNCKISLNKTLADFLKKINTFTGITTGVTTENYYSAILQVSSRVQEALSMSGERS
jgi:hypothetical protein